MEDLLFYISNAVYVLGLILFVFAFRSRKQTEILLFNGLSAVALLLYFVLEGAWAASVSMVAAGAGSFLQVYLVSQGKSSASKSRIIVSLVFTILGIAAVYSGPPDIYIMLAVAASRFGELSDDTRRVKLGYLLADSLWFVYAAEVGMPSVYWGCMAIISFMVYEMIKEYREVFARAQSTSLVA